MLDIQIVWDVAVAARAKNRGARRRVASKHGVVPATVTEAVKRVETAMGIPLFSAGSQNYADALTSGGRAFLHHGDTFLKSYQLFRKFVQDADENPP